MVRFCLGTGPMGSGQVVELGQGFPHGPSSAQAGLGSLWGQGPVLQLEPRQPGSMFSAHPPQTPAPFFSSLPTHQRLDRKTSGPRHLGSCRGDKRSVGTGGPLWRPAWPPMPGPELFLLPLEPRQSRTGPGGPSWAAVLSAGGWRSWDFLGRGLGLPLPSFLGFLASQCSLRPGVVSC